MNEYFEGSVSQLLERTRQLCDLIPAGLGREVAALDVACRDRLDMVGKRLRLLRDLPELQESDNQRERLRLFRRARGELDHLESVAVTALCRWNAEDRWMNQLADCLAREIRYPLPTPVISCASQRYFHTYPDLRLVYVPLAEGRFLLHLPDLYHELAHSLLEFENDGRLVGFQERHVEAVSEAHKYLASELRKENTGLGPETFKRYLMTWIDCWLSWAIEFFCDLYAVYMVGPAFAWSHLHLAASTGTDPFEVPLMTTKVHPPDAARMTALLLGLERLGFHNDRAAIACRWEEFFRLSGSKMSPEYRRCFPDELVSRVVRLAFDGTQALGCDVAGSDMKGSGRLLLNEAWRVFWRSPSEYVEWEQRAVKQHAQAIGT